MSETKTSRRGRGEDAIYFATAKNRYVGSVSLGYGPDGKRIRRKVFGRTKQEVREKLKALHQELNAGVRSFEHLHGAAGRGRLAARGAGWHIGADPYPLRGLAGTGAGDGRRQAAA
jgi:hypothetical protein